MPRLVSSLRMRELLYWVWDGSTEWDVALDSYHLEVASLSKSNHKTMGSIKGIPRNRAKRMTRKNGLFSAYILLNLAHLIDQLYFSLIIFNECYLPALSVWIASPLIKEVKILEGGRERQWMTTRETGHEVTQHCVLNKELKLRLNSTTLASEKTYKTIRQSW